MSSRRDSEPSPAFHEWDPDSSEEFSEAESDDLPSRAEQTGKHRVEDPVPSIPDAITGVTWEEWRRTWFSVRKLAIVLTKSETEWKDVRQEVYARVLTTRKWDRERVPSFRRHMLRTTRSIFEHNQGKLERREGYEETAIAEDDLYERGRYPSPEYVAIKRQDQARAVRALSVLQRLLARFSLALRVIDVTAQEIDEPEEQAEALGCTVADVYRERARIKRYRQRVYEIVDGEKKEKA